MINLTNNFSKGESMSKKKNGIFLYITLVFAVLLAKVLGLLRGILLSSAYGTGVEASAFTAVSNLPLILFDVTFGTAITSAFVPVFNEKLASENKDEANKFASNFFNVILFFSFVVVLFGILFPKTAVMLVASGFASKPEALSLSVSLIKLIMPIMTFACCTYIFIGILQSYGEFVAPALVSTFSNLFMIVYLLFFNKTLGIKGLAIAFCLGWMCQFVFLIPFLYKKKFKYYLKFNLLSDDIKKVAILTLPLFVASLSQPINQLISSNFSSSVSENGVATVNYAYNAYLIVAGVFSYALTNMFFPEMSRRFAKNDIDGANHICTDMISSISAIIIPIMSFFIACSQPIIKLLYQRGQFLATDTVNVASLLVIYSVGMIFLSWQDIFNKYFYSMQKSFIPMIASAVGILVNITLSFLLVRILGLKGLAIATVVSGVVMTFVLALFAWNISRAIFNKTLFIEVGKTIIAGSFAFCICRFFSIIFGFEGSFAVLFIKLVVALILALVMYVLILLILKSKNLKTLIDTIKERKKNDV